jgi:hypothetical protein
MSKGDDMSQVRFTRPLLVLSASILVQACAATTLAPGADKVRLTRDAADVSSCAAVGNITPAQDAKGDTFSTPASFQNQAIGLGGNTVLVTQQYMGAPISGVVYRCSVAN